MNHPFALRYKQGQIILLALVFAGIFAMVSTALVGFVNSYGRAERATVAAAQALAIAEGALENTIGKLNQNPAYAGETNTALGEGTFTTTITNIDSDTKRITATGYIPNSSNPVATKIVKADIAINSSVISFHYGVQAGNGGFTLDNSAKIFGNVFSSGPVVGIHENYVYGDVISSGPTGWVYGIHATSSIYAHTIGSNQGEDTKIDKNAYYATTKVNTEVTGESFPNSPDQPNVPLPISDEQINEWKTDAAAGDPITSCDSNGNYTIDSDVTLGPQKIECNLIVKSSSAILTITGPLWVAGNITTQTGPKIKMSPSLGSTNVPIIADNPADQTGSGIITIGQTTIFEGSGSPGSFVFLISQNRSAEQGGSTVAISMSQGASALVAYASHGLVTLTQSVNVKEVTGYKISLAQTSRVTYDNGLPSAVFQTGPGGSWSFVPGSYAITR